MNGEGTQQYISLSTAIFKMNNQQGPTYCIAHGTLLNATWQSGWEGSLGENDLNEL